MCQVIATNPMEIVKVWREGEGGRRKEGEGRREGGRRRKNGRLRGEMSISELRIALGVGNPRIVQRSEQGRHEMRREEEGGRTKKEGGGRRRKEEE
jgi:hypothetical protein